MFFYWGSGSPPCWKAMIVLQEKGLWEGIPNKLLEFSKKEHKGEEVLKMNPRGQVSIKRLMRLIVRKLVLAHRIRISEILPWDRKSFIIYKVMKYRKILIKYNAYFKKSVFHWRENIKSCIFTAVKI